MQPLTNTSSDRFLTFRIGQQLYALRAEDVSEVMLLPALARIPQAPAALQGVANLRGAIVPVVSLRELLGKPPLASTPDTRAIVLDVGAAVALIVDGVEILETATAQQIEAHNSELTAADAEKLLGVFTVGPTRVAAKILDIKAMLEATFVNRAHPRRQNVDVTVRDSRAGNDDSRDREILVTFEVADQEFGFMLDAVQEILPLPPTITAVARADAAVLGVISVRDALLPVMSLRALLGFPALPIADAREKIVIIDVAGARVGVVADCARAVVVADPGLIDPIPLVLAARAGGESRIRAIYRGDAGRRLISILSPGQLFREDIMQKLVADHNARNGQAVTAETARQDELIFLIFKLGGDEFGLPVDSVVEVAQVPVQITRVPKTPAFLEGVVNLRGEVLPVIDQRRRFDMPRLDTVEGRRLIVVQTERHLAGLIVDSVTGVLRILPETIEPPPDLTDATTRLVKGVINLEESARLVLVLDPAEVLTRAEQGLLDTFDALGKAGA